MTGHSSRRPRSRPFAALASALALCCLVAGRGSEAAAYALPTSGDQLLSAVRAALEKHDLTAFEELVHWDGASKMKRRVVSYQLRHGFGRPIRSITLEPFPADGFDAIEESGRMRPNMAVSQQLRVVFDEPDTAYGKPPTTLFLIGRQANAYRIALVVPAEKPGGDDD